MITLKTITTIELSNICNLKCDYCVQPLMKEKAGAVREFGIMSEEVFERSLYWLKILCQRGTQKEVNLNGNGESCLDPMLPERIRRVKDVVGSDRKVCMSTNGVNMTPELAKKMVDAGIDQCDLSPHSPFHARKAILMMMDAGIRGVINMGAIVMSHNWAGQLPDDKQIKCRLSNPCDSLAQGRGYIQKEGNVAPCCYDYRNLGVFGNVFENDLLCKPIKPYVLCATCHQVIEPEVMEAVLS